MKSETTPTRKDTPKKLPMSFDRVDENMFTCLKVKSMQYEVSTKTPLVMLTAYYISAYVITVLKLRGALNFQENKHTPLGSCEAPNLIFYPRNIASHNRKFLCLC